MLELPAASVKICLNGKRAKSHARAALARAESSGETACRPSALTKARRDEGTGKGMYRTPCVLSGVGAVHEVATKARAGGGRPFKARGAFEDRWRWGKGTGRGNRAFPLRSAFFRDLPQSVPRGCLRIE